MIPSLGVWAFIIVKAVFPLEEERFTFVFEQNTEFTCGLAAAASLASIYWGIDITENDLFKLLPMGAAEDIRERRAISLHELQQVLIYLGFEAGGFALNYPQLAQASQRYGPLICHLKDPEGHFVLFIGDMAGYAILADPARGVIAIPAGDFAPLWSHTALAVLHPEQPMRIHVVEKVRAQAAARLSMCTSWCLR